MERKIQAVFNVPSTRSIKLRRKYATFLVAGCLYELFRSRRAGLGKSSSNLREILKGNHATVTASRDICSCFRRNGVPSTSGSWPGNAENCTPPLDTPRPMAVC